VVFCKVFSNLYRVNLIAVMMMMML